MEFNTLSLILCIALVVIGIVCFFIGITYRKKVAEKEIGSAEEEARRIINESIKLSLIHISEPTRRAINSE